METTKYHRLVIKHGIFTMLLVLDYLIDEENYEECGKIEAAIKRCEIFSNKKHKRVIDAELFRETENILRKNNIDVDEAYARYLNSACKILSELGYHNVEFKEYVFDNV